jgi:phosphatidylglycerol:prolipoprotein diacylglycerol transferase
MSWLVDYRRYAYAACMLLALAAFLVVRRFQPRTPGAVSLPWWTRLGLGLAAFIGGSLGAKLPFVFGTLFHRLAEPPTPFDVRAFLTEFFFLWFADGKTVTAGLIGAYVAVEIAKRLLDVRAKTGDSFAAPLAFAMAVGRWGCFINGCCYGTPTDLPWGVPLLVSIGPDHFECVKCHPTQIYESVFHLLMGVVLLGLARRDLLPGNRLKLYLIAYGVYRFFTEFIRPERTDYAGLTFYQWAALLIVVGLAAQWAWDSGRPAARATI